mmetsp:Transcript_34680/g.82900  ORF Transcript_34680/g.82900 Transcript_34680/m.82900 type:complete len:97 (+) Transcript_34680:1432-1722(+)
MGVDFELVQYRRQQLKFEQSFGPASTGWHVREGRKLARIQLLFGLLLPNRLSHYWNRPESFTSPCISRNLLRDASESRGEGYQGSLVWWKTFVLFF